MSRRPQLHNHQGLAREKDPESRTQPWHLEDLAAGDFSRTAELRGGTRPSTAYSLNSTVMGAEAGNGGGASCPLGSIHMHTWEPASAAAATTPGSQHLWPLHLYGQWHFVTHQCQEQCQEPAMPAAAPSRASPGQVQLLICWWFREHRDLLRNTFQT